MLVCLAGELFLGLGAVSLCLVIQFLDFRESYRRRGVPECDEYNDCPYEGYSCRNCEAQIPGLHTES